MGSPAGPPSVPSTGLPVGAADAPSPPGRRLVSPRWLDLRLITGVVLVVGAVLLGALVVGRSDRTEAVVTARRDLAAGTVLRAPDLVVSQVRLADGAGRVYLRDLSAAVGRTLTRPVAADELLPAAAVRRSPARTTLTLALAEGAAPALRSGQRIQVWLSTPTCAFVVLLSEVTVQSVSTDDGGAFGSAGGDGQRVVISVPPDVAPRVVAAQSIPDATLRAGILTGTSASSPSSPSTSPSSLPTSPATTSPGGSAGSGLPADLAGCAGSGGSAGGGER